MTKFLEKLGDFIEWTINNVIDTAFDHPWYTLWLLTCAASAGVMVSYLVGLPQ